MVGVARKRRWWIRIPLGVLCLMLTCFAAFVLEHGRPKLSIGRDLADLAEEEQIAILALTDHVERYPWNYAYRYTQDDTWLPGSFGFYQDEAGKNPIAAACTKQNVRVLSKLKQVLDDAGYVAANPLCNTEYGFVVWKDNRGNYWAGRGYGGVYTSVTFGRVVMIWNTGEWIE